MGSSANDVISPFLREKDGGAMTAMGSLLGYGGGPKLSSVVARLC
jgi:hypothetical protein